MTQHWNTPRPSTSAGKKLGIAMAVLVGAPVLVTGVVQGVKQNAAKPAAAATPQQSQPAASATRKPTPAPPASSAPAASPSRPAPGPTFTYPGDPQCAITYVDSGGGAMTWTVATTVNGELITHASGADGTIYRHDEQTTAGTHTYRAPVPLSSINDVGGNLQGNATSYGCSVAPQR